MPTTNITKSNIVGVGRAVISSGRAKFGLNCFGPGRARANLIFLNFGPGRARANSFRDRVRLEPKFIIATSGRAQARAKKFQVGLASGQKNLKFLGPFSTIWP